MIIDWIKKNIILLFKIIWWTILLLSGIYYIYNNYSKILVSASIIDNIIIVSTFILAFFPLINEISLMGFSMKKELQSTKQEMKEALLDLKYQIIDVKSTTTQNTTQSLVIECLPSKEDMENTLKKTIKSKEKNEQIEAEIKNDFNIPENTIYLFGVRFNIEKYIININNNIGNIGFTPIMKGINNLREKNIITYDMQQSLRQVLNICNRSIHGEVISEEYINFVKKVVPQIYNQLEETNQRIKNQYFVICPRCKFSGYSEYINVCPICGFVNDDY